MKLKVIAVTVFVIALLAFNASAGCGKWVIRDNTDYLEDPTFDAAVASSTPASTTGDKVSESDTQKSAQPDAKKDKIQTPDISGKWLVKLGEASIPLNLILIQSKDRVQGYGSLEDRNTEIPATATGSVSEKAVNLEVRLVVDGSLNKMNKKYTLNLAMLNGALPGTYESYLGGKLEEKGNVTATRL